MYCKYCGVETDNKSGVCDNCKNKEIKKFPIWIILAIILVIVLAGIILFILGKKDADDYTNRYEWAKLLTQAYNLNSHDTEEQFYSDVDNGSEYYIYVQAIGHWDIVNDTQFAGNKAVTGEYTALTAMKAIGKYKIKIYLEQKEELTDNEYLELAVREGIISKENINKKLKIDECEELLARSLGFMDKVNQKSGYSVVEYQDGVVDLIEDKTLSFLDEEYLLMENVEKNLKEGDVFVFKDSFGQIIGRKVTKLNSDETYSLTEVGISDVYKTLEVADNTTITFEDVLNGGDWDSIEYDVYEPMSTKKIDYEVVPLAWTDKEISFNEFTISVAAESDGIKIEAVCPDLHIKASKTIKYKKEEFRIVDPEELSGNDDELPDASTKLEVKISNANLRYQMSRSGLKVNYLDVAANIDDTCTITLLQLSNSENYQDIPIMEATPIFSNGAVSLKLKMYIHIDASGKAEIRCDLPVDIGMQYEKDNGFRATGKGCEMKNPGVVAKGEIEAFFVPELLPCVGGLAIIDIEPEIGMHAHAEMDVRTNSNVLVCSEVNLAAPLLKVAIGQDNKELHMADIIIDAFFDNGDLEFVILDENNAPFKGTKHYELMNDNTINLVEKCTYESKSIMPNDNESKALFEELMKYKDERKMLRFGGYCFQSANMENGYMADSSWTDKGDHYEVDGYMYSPVIIIPAGNNRNGDDGSSEFVGKTITIYGHELSLWDYAIPTRAKSIINGYEKTYIQKDKAKAIPVKSFDGEAYNPDDTMYFLYGPFDEPWEPHYYERYYNLDTTVNEASNHYFWILCEGEEGFYEDEGDTFDLQLDCAWYGAYVSIPNVSDQKRTFYIKKDSVLAITESDMGEEQLISMEDVYSGKNTYKNVSDFYDFFKDNGNGWSPFARARFSLDGDGHVFTVVPSPLND